MDYTVTPVFKTIEYNANDQIQYITRISQQKNKKIIINQKKIEKRRKKDPVPS